jgi:CheY-like chemotaxis protein
VVDDLQEKHVVFRTILDELGENIVSARSGKEALRFILEKEFAVILLDVNMPDIDGLETASLIRHYKKSAQTPIVFITAYVDELQAKRGYALGAVDYIPSPVVPEVLRSKVRVFVELYRMNRQLQLRAVEREALARSEAARPRRRRPSTGPTTCPKSASSCRGRWTSSTPPGRCWTCRCRCWPSGRCWSSPTGRAASCGRWRAAATGWTSLPAGARETVTEVLHERQFHLWQDGAAAAAICPIATGDACAARWSCWGDASSSMAPGRVGQGSGQPGLDRHGERPALQRRAGGGPAQERVPGDAGARAAQPARAHPQCRAHHARHRCRRRPPCTGRATSSAGRPTTWPG